MSAWTSSLNTKQCKNRTRGHQLQVPMTFSTHVLECAVYIYRQLLLVLQNNQLSGATIAVFFNIRRQTLVNDLSCSWMLHMSSTLTTCFKFFLSASAFSAKMSTRKWLNKKQHATHNYIHDVNVVLSNMTMAYSHTITHLLIC